MRGAVQVAQGSWPDIVALTAEAEAAAGTGGEGKGEGVSGAWLEHVRTRPQARLLVARIGRTGGSTSRHPGHPGHPKPEAAGFIAYGIREASRRPGGSRRAPTIAYVYLLHVCKRARGEGVGRQLVDALMREVEPGTHVVLQATPCSEAFWEKAGFIRLDDPDERRTYLAACEADVCLHEDNVGLAAYVKYGGLG